MKGAIFSSSSLFNSRHSQKRTIKRSGGVKKRNNKRWMPFMLGEMTEKIDNNAADACGCHRQTGGGNMRNKNGKV
jgi:hypothetical protein